MNSHYYLHIVKAPLISSLKYFLVFFLLVGLYQNLNLYFNLLPKVKVETVRIISEVKKNFPYDLEISYKDRKLSSSIDPLYVTYPLSLNKIEGLEFSEDKFLMMDKSINKDNVASLASQSALAINQTQLFLKNYENNWTLQEVRLSDLFNLLEIKDFVLNYQTIGEVCEQVKINLLNFYQIIFYIISFSWPFLLIISRLILSLFESLFVYFFFRVFEIRLSYKKVWQISLHVFTISQLITLIGQQIYDFDLSFLFSLSYWLIILYLFFMFRKFKRKKVTS
jgi:hypothetical protein